MTNEHHIKLHLLSNDVIIAVLSALSERKEVERMEYLISLILSVMGSVVGNLITKWLDRHRSDN